MRFWEQKRGQAWLIDIFASFSECQPAFADDASPDGVQEWIFRCAAASVAGAAAVHHISRKVRNDAAGNGGWGRGYQRGKVASGRWQATEGREGKQKHGQDARAPFCKTLRDLRAFAVIFLPPVIL